MLQPIGAAFTLLALAFALTCLIQWLLHDLAGRPPEAEPPLPVAPVTPDEARRRRQAVIRLYLARRYGEGEQDGDPG